MVHKSIRQNVWHNDKIAANACMGQEESIGSFSTYTLLVYMVFTPYIKVYIVDYFGLSGLSYSGFEYDFYTHSC